MTLLPPVPSVSLYPGGPGNSSESAGPSIRVSTLLRPSWSDHFTKPVVILGVQAEIQQSVLSLEWNSLSWTWGHSLMLCLPSRLAKELWLSPNFTLHSTLSLNPTPEVRMGHTVLC